MPLHLKFHGALGQVTGSCSFFRVQSSGNIYAVDCGSAHKRDVLQEPAHPVNLPKGCQPAEVKGLFLTHAHADHIGMLLHWVKGGFKGPIYCTSETAKFAYFACEDSLRILLRENPSPDVGEAEKVAAQKMLETYIACEPSACIEIEPGLNVVSYPTSHILGCVGYQFAAKDQAGAIRRIFFTGDVGTVEDETETRSMMRQRVRPSLPSDFVITEATYGDKQRKPGDRSGKARLERMAEVLERGFRHGPESKLIFPAFSLQRSQDLLIDVFQVLNYNRAATGLSAGVVPKVYLDSSLASSFASIFRDVYREGVGSPSPWVNPAAAFIAWFNGDLLAVDEALERLFRFESPGACVRLYGGGEAIEVFCGPFREGAQGPSVIISGSGTTNHGAVQRYLYDHVEDSSATFVVSGYVPPRSPGSALLKIFEMTAEARSATLFELKEDKMRNLPKKNLFGSDIKSGCFSIAEFYSGHADGPSICRYIIGDTEADLLALKRVFLMHGEDISRDGLARLLEDRFQVLISSDERRPSVECPYPDSPWFDCGSNRWIEDQSVITSHTVLVPASGDIMQVAQSVFDPMNISIEAGQSYLTLRANRASSRTSLRVKQFNDTHAKLVVLTSYEGVDGLLEAGRVAFRWREVLNALQLQKTEYFAGHKLCVTEKEFQEFEGIRRNLIHGGKQRLHGFVVAGKTAFSSEELSALEALLTPHVPIFVLDNQYLSRLNAALFSTSGQQKLSKSAAFYVPIQVADKFIPISRPYGWECLRNLLLKVAADAQIKSTRYASRPNSVAAESAPQRVATVPAGTKIPPERANLPETAYACLKVGEKVTAIVVAPFATGRSKGMKLKVLATGALGAIYGVNYQQGKFEHSVGHKLDVYIRLVDSASRTIEFILTPPCFSDEAVRQLDALRGRVTWRRMAELLTCDIRTLSGLVGDYGKLLVTDYTKIAAEQLVPDGVEVQIYRMIVSGLEADRIKRTSLPPAAAPFTFGKMAGMLGGEWTSSDVLYAAQYFAGGAQERLQTMAIEILSLKPTGVADDVFPLGHKDLFIAACYEASDAQWKRVPVVATEAPARLLPAPSYHVLRELASIWGLTPAELLLEAENLGIVLRSDVVLSDPEAKLLAGKGRV